MKDNTSRVLAIVIVLGIAVLLCNPAVWISFLGFIIEGVIFLAIVNLISRLIFGKSFRKLLFGKEDK